MSQLVCVSKRFYTPKGNGMTYSIENRIEKWRKFFFFKKEEKEKQLFNAFRRSKDLFQLNNVNF